jgi:uncharacterized membrane-anchored protein YjiN (DUF445 family)
MTSPRLSPPFSRSARRTTAEPDAAPAAGAPTSSPAPGSALPEFRSQERKQHQLTITKRRATGLLAATTVVFIATVVAGAHGGWLGYVQAAAEASMVGGLADWFAVTALFRHPLGVPIPHTAIIVERKAQFAETLGEFVQNSFLTPDAIVDRVRRAGVVDRVADWLGDDANSRRLAGYIAEAGVGIADLVRDEDVQAAVETLVRDRLSAVSVAPLLGRALRFVTAEGRHREVLDAAIAGLDRYLDEHRAELRARLAEQAPWWLPGAVEDRIFERLFEGARAVVRDAAANTTSQLRGELETRLADLAGRLEESADLRTRGDKLRDELLGQPQVREWIGSMWTDAKRNLRAQAEDPESELRARLADAVRSAGARLHEDPKLAGVVEESIENAVRYVAEHFHGDISDVITTTVQRWDAEDTARRLELLLGPDLQFIRINGTVVGGAVGLVLHALASVLGH